MASFDTSLYRTHIGCEVKEFEAQPATAALSAARAGWGELGRASRLALVAAAAVWLGAPWRSALVIGALVAMSSTALVLGLLAERGELDAPHGQLALGILLFQDLCVVPFLLAVPVALLRAWRNGASARCSSPSKLILLMLAGGFGALTLLASRLSVFAVFFLAIVAGGAIVDLRRWPARGVVCVLNGAYSTPRTPATCGVRGTATNGGRSRGLSSSLLTTTP